MMVDHSSKRAPNIRGMISFSRRISNLVVTEVLSNESVKMRARLITRYINVAGKLHNIHNFQSTRSILIGLQSDSIYRLKKTWDYIRHHHSSKYQLLYKLLKLHRDPKTRDYRAMFESNTSAPPYLPSLPYLITALLGHFPHTRRMKRGQHKPANHLTTARSSGYFCTELEGALEDSTMESDNSVPPNAKPDCLVQCLGAHVPLDGPIKIEAAYQLLGIWQKAARQYCFVENKTAMEFLMKTHYREERENFLRSLQVEPSTTED